VVLCNIFRGFDSQMIGALERHSFSKLVTYLVRHDMLVFDGCDELAAGDDNELSILMTDIRDLAKKERT